MKMLKNPYESVPGYNCFGCSKHNDHGLRMDFFEDGDYIVSKWDPVIYFQGFVNVLHGGIQSTLMDEIASWVVFVKLETGGFTSRLSTRFKKPVMINQGQITLKAKLREMQRNIAVIDVELYDSNNVLCSVSVAEYFTLSQDDALKKMEYPGIDAFR